MNPHTLIFDWDNTLVDTWPVIHAALNNTLSEMDMPHWSLGELKARVVHLTDREYLAERMFGPDKEKAKPIFSRAFEQVHLAELTPMPDAGALLARLSASGWPLAIASNKHGYLVRREVAKLGWEQYFTCIVGADEAGRDKPAPDVVHAILDQLGRTPGDGVWLVGDTVADMQCAANSGCRPILVRGHAPEEGEFIGCEPLHHVASCAALDRLILDLPPVGQPAMAG